jgi:hypothetical protein
MDPSVRLQIFFPQGIVAVTILACENNENQEQPSNKQSLKGEPSLPSKQPAAEKAWQHRRDDPQVPQF